MEIVWLKESKESDPGWCRAWELFMESAAEGDLLCADMGQEGFRDKFSGSKDGAAAVNLMEKEGSAFASGCFDPGSGKLFVTMVAVRRKMRRQGRGREILAALERALEEAGGCREGEGVFELSFFNPVTLAWKVPGREGVTHPNMPGVDVSGGAYLFFKNCGYREFALQNSYYLDLREFVYSEAFKRKKQKLGQEGITFRYYDSRVHRGMKEMLQGFGNPLWEKEILGEPCLEEGGRPVLAPVQDGQVLGFTGPLSVEPGGRGYFAGIAISAEARGKGLGKLLFYELCSGLKDRGAAYMTLFTGENNPARNIYEEAGFGIVRSWSDMRKGAAR